MSEFVYAKVEIDETAATIAADRKFIAPAVDAIKSARNYIERQIRRDRFFLTTLEPYEPPDDCSATVRRMCDAARVAGVGPMAAVAGTIAQAALEAMVAAGCTHGWVDNSGDIAVLAESPTTVEVFTDPGSRTARAMELEPTEGILGICSSSGKLGHSISFGNADIALVVAESAPLADALATAIGNRVTDVDSLATCFDPFKRIDGLIGSLVLLDGAAAAWGALPRLVDIEHNPDRLTAHSKMSSERYTGFSGRTQEARV